MSLISTILTIYIWGIVCVLLYFLFAIARFYQQKSGRRSYYQAFLVSLALFALAALRYIFVSPTAITGDVWGDLLRFSGGLIAGGFGLFLLRLMIGGRT
jgi:hypothetical protein